MRGKEIRLIYLVPSKGISYDQKGGAGTHIRGTINALKNKGIIVTPVIHGSLHVNKDFHANNTSPNYAVYQNLKSKLPKQLTLFLQDIRIIFDDLVFFSKAYKLIKKNKSKIIYERSCFLSISGLILSKLFNQYYYVETSGALVEIFINDYGTTLRPLANLVEKLKLKFADCIVTESNASIDFVRKKYELKDKQIISKPLGITSLQANAYDIPTIKKLKLKLNISPEDFVLGYVGTFASYHNVDFLISTFKMINNPHIKLILVGAGGGFTHIKKRVEEENIKNVIFTGYIPNAEVSNYFALMQVGVIPNCEEHLMPIKTYEYGLHSICPLVPRYYGSMEIEKYNAGILFKALNSTSLKEQILYLFKNRELVERYGKAWNKIVLENYLWDTTIQALVDNIIQNN